MRRSRLLLLIGIAALGCLLPAWGEAAPQNLNRAEEYVRQQAARGEAADLRDRFGDNKECRTLSSRFLADLLTGTYKVQWQGIRIYNAIINDKLDLNHAHITIPIALVNCHFQGPVYGRNAFFEKRLNLDGSHFTQEVDFGGLKVRQSAILKKAVFSGPVEFEFADIGGQLNARGAEFKRTAYWGGLKVGQDALFEQAIFNGPVDFTRADIDGYFIAFAIKFADENETADFTGLSVGQSALFDNSIFCGPVNFIYADIGGQFSARGANFTNELERAEFYSIKVGRDAFYDNAIFKGPVDFTNADIHGRFTADGSSYKQQVGFEGMRAGQGASFQAVTFNGMVDLAYGIYLDLYLEGIGVEKAEDENQGRSVGLKLKGTTVQRELSLINLKLATLEAPYLRVKGSAIFADLDISEQADFQQAFIENLKFKNIVTLPAKEKMMLHGLTYTSLHVDEENEFPKGLQLVHRSAFNPQNYLQLEDCCKRFGRKDSADIIHIEMKERELAMSGWNKPHSWLEWFFSGILTGYGRKPERLLSLWFTWILFGMFFFDPKFIENGGWVTRSKFYHPWLMRFWLSLDRFIPGIDLELAKKWNPRNQVSTSVWMTWYAHKFLGWCLIPLGFSFLASLMK
jgi:hypothetical protein